MAVTNSVGGAGLTGKTPTSEFSFPLNTSRNAIGADANCILSNTSASAVTYTVVSGLGVDFAVVLQQVSTGTVTVAAGAGVTLIGSTLATNTSGGMLAVVPTATPNTYIVKAN